jgi:hypothetical protein
MAISNFRAPDPNREYFSGGLDIETIYKICSKNKRKFKVQQVLSKINNKIQNYTPNFSIVDAITDISVASDFTTHQ